MEILYFLVPVIVLMLVLFALRTRKAREAGQKGQATQLDIERENARNLFGDNTR